MSLPFSRAFPTRVARLPELAYDLCWTWNRTREVFRRLDHTLWQQTSHNAVLLLERVTPGTLERAIADPAFLARYDEAVAEMDRNRTTTDTWWRRAIEAGVSPFCTTWTRASLGR